MLKMNSFQGEMSTEQQEILQRASVQFNQEFFSMKPLVSNSKQKEANFGLYPGEINLS